jgi:hypothetical protein
MAHAASSLLATPSRRSTLNRNQWVALVLIAFGCIAKEAPKFYADTGSATLQASNTGRQRAPPPPPHAAAAVSDASSYAPSAAGAKLQADVAAWLLLAAQMLCSICAGERWAARRRCSTSRSRATHHTSIASLTTAFGNHSKGARPARVSHPAALPLPQASTTSCC